LIIMGGTFLEYPKKFQYEFIKNCYDALNEKKSRTIEAAQKLNEKAKHRCVALCVETRPDECVKYIKQMREFGVTRVELGVQIPDDKIYKIIKRGHFVKDVVDATRELKNVGFKVGYHIMPGLPSSNPKKDLQLFKKLFSDEKFKPDQLKIYPCQVIKGSKLEEIYWKKKYKPYTKEQLEKLISEMLKIVPRYCRVMRIMREIPPDYLIAGTTRIDLRKDVEEKLRKNKNKIVEIRFREIGFALGNPAHPPQEKLKLKITKYIASGGNEYFLEIVNDDDILFGLLRLRIINDKAIIRELHVYGQSLKLGEKGNLSQHIGLGKWLMSEAEKIAKGSEQVQASSDDKPRAKEKCKKIFVISGIGVREYYRKLGYKLEDTYMVKKLN
jgi:elongator complex protein 3